jgi:hypothetical protein
MLRLCSGSFLPCDWVVLRVFAAAWMGVFEEMESGRNMTTL